VTDWTTWALVVGLVAQVTLPAKGLVWATVRGHDSAGNTVRPSRVSYAIWTVEAAIGFAASAAAGAGLGALVVLGGAGFMLGATFAATFTRAARALPPPPSEVGWQRWVSPTCAVICTAALVGWAAVRFGWVPVPPQQGPAVALALVIIADGLAAVPTLRQAWRGQEPWVPYLGFALNALCGFVVLAAAGQWAFTKWGFVAYQLGITVTLTGESPRTWCRSGFSSWLPVSVSVPEMEGPSREAS
jgi:hypothetical protein